MNGKYISTLCLMIVLTVFTCNISMAAYFRVDSDSGAAVQAGDSFSLKVYITPLDGEKLMGAKCTLNVDPEFIEIATSREDFAADPSFKFVESFKTDPGQGMVTFRARTAEEVEDETLFLVVPAKLKKEGATFVNFTSSALGADDKWSPSTPGYFKMLGTSGESVDPLLASTLENDNSLLNTGSFFHSYRIKPQDDSTISTMQFDMGMTALEQAGDDENADIIVKFSKSSARIGTGKYVRLDLIVDKYPENVPVFTGIDVMIKYDPSYLQFTNSTGQAASQVEIVKRLEETPVPDLKKLAKAYELEYSSVDFRGESKPAAVQKQELTQLIRAYEGYRDETIFSFPFGAEDIDLSNNRTGSSPEDTRTIASALDANFVDNAKGEIHLMLLVDFSLKREDIQMPQKVVTLIFKGLRPGENIPVEITQALLGEASGKLLLKNSYVTVDPKQEACDKTLPATLCQGTFKITGDVAFDITKRRTQRAGSKRDADNNLVPTTTIVEKFALTETWNLHMNGSLENGLKVNGHINKIPYQEQKLDIGIIGDNGSIRFGDFNTGFNGTSKVNSLSSQISGMELQYGFDDYTFSALMAEGRSETKTAQINGNDIKQYSLPAGAIITNSVQIARDDGTGKVVDPAEYSIDYSRNTVTFKEFIPKGDNFIVTYEQSTFLFSSGNINTFGLAYDSQKDNPQKKERFKVDSAFMTSTATKGSQRFYQDTSETLNLGELSEFLETCPKKSNTNTGYVERTNCRTVYLKNRNIVKESIQIIVGSNTYTGADKGVYITHRSYSIGKVTLDSDEGFKGNITIKYSFYDESAIYDKRMLLLNNGDPIVGNIGINEIGISWPSDAIPGSEEIYISRNNDYSISQDDRYIDYKYPGIDPWIDELEDTEFSRTSLFDTGSAVSSALTYYFDTQFLDIFPSILKFDADIGSEGADYKYLKMRYKSAPPDIEGSSEFAKTALGVDLMYQPKKNLRFDAQYALTNSDLTSSYVSYEETIYIDAVTTGIDQPSNDPNINNNNCQYLIIGEGSTKTRKLVCGLAHSNIKTPAGVALVDVSIQFCKFEGDDPRDSCIKKPDGSYVYEDAVYEFTSVIHHQLIAIDGNTIIFKRRVDENSGAQKDESFKGAEFANVNHRFITEGDRIFVRYLYSQTQDQLVEGDALTLKADYTGKKMSLALTKNITDPYYDKSFQGKLLDGGNSNVDTTNLKLNYRVNKQWSTTFEKTSSTNEKLEAGITSSTADSDITNYSLHYANSKAKHLNSFSYYETLTDKTGTQGLGIKQQNINDSNNVRRAKLSMTVKKNIMTMNTEYKTTDVKNSITPNLTNLTTAKTLDTIINPFSMLSMKMKFETSVSTAGANSRANNYQATLKPLKLFTIDMNFDRTSKTTSSVAASNLSENNTYKISFLPFYKVSNFTLDLTQLRTPASNTITYDTGNEKRTAKFDFKLMKDLVFTPTLTQSSSRTESLTENGIDAFQLKYKPSKNRFKLIITLNASTTDTTTYTKYLSDIQTVSYDNKSDRSVATTLQPSKKSNLIVNYKNSSAENTPANNYQQYDIKYKIDPSPNTTFSTSYLQKLSSTTPRGEYGFNYSYNYTSKLSFSTSYKKTSTGSVGAADLVVTSYDFNTSLKLNDSSTLDMTYRQTLTDGARNNSYIDVPNFSARLRSSFK